MPYENYHSARIIKPSKLVSTSFRYKNIDSGIDIIIGKNEKDGNMVTQAYRFDKTKFTEQQAKEWLDKHKINYISFEKAKEEGETMKDEKDKQMQDDGRPPEDWWNKCISSVSGKADDPAALCGWTYYHQKQMQDEQPKIPETEEEIKKCQELMKQTEIQLQDQKPELKIEGIQLIPDQIAEYEKILNALKITAVPDAEKLAIEKFKDLYEVKEGIWVKKVKEQKAGRGDEAGKPLSDIFFITSQINLKEEKDFVIIELLKAQKFIDPQRYGEWEITEQDLDEVYRNFKDDITGYKISGVLTEHNKEGDAAGYIEDLEKKNGSLLAKFKLNDLGKEKILKDKSYFYVSPELETNYIDKRSGLDKGLTLKRFIFTNTPYQPDLKPVVSLSDIKFNYIYLYEEAIEDMENIRNLKDSLEKSSLEIKNLTDKVKGLEIQAKENEIENVLKIYQDKGIVVPANREQFKILMMTDKVSTLKLLDTMKPQIGLAETTEKVDNVNRESRKGTVNDPAIIQKAKDLNKDLSDYKNFREVYKTIYPKGHLE